MYQKFVARFNSISFTFVTALCALLPLFFLPATLGGLGSVKGSFLYIGVFLAFSFWLVAQFVDGNLRVPKAKALAVLGLWVLLTLVSALSSVNVRVSLWGRGFAIDSFATVLVLSLFAFLVASFAREQHRLVKLFLATFSGMVLTLVLQIVLYISQTVPFVAKYFSHVSTQGTLVGSWVDFAHFVTFIFLLALLMYEVLMPKGFFKVLSLFAMLLSLVTLIFLNFKAAWVVTIISSLLVFVYKSSVERSLSRFIPVTDTEEEVVEQRFPAMSFISLLIALFFFLSSASIGGVLSQRAGISFTDIRPSFSTTSHVMRASLAHDPLFGAGAGRFGDVWNLYRPSSLNSSYFWNTSFESGYSMIQTLLATNGIIPTLALVLVLFLTLIHGFKLFNYKFPDRFSRFIAVSALIMLIAFIVLFLFTSPGLVLVSLGFLYLGLLLGVSTLVGKTRILAIQYLRDPRLSFFAILVLVLSAMAGFTAVYFSANRYASVVIYNRALAAGDFETAARRLDRALSLSQNDIYWRTRVAMYTTEFTNKASATNTDKAVLQSYFTQAEQSARAAVSWDPGSSANWLLVSQVYQLVAGGQDKDAYTNAKQAADEAQKRNPNNPLLVLNQAQLALTQKDTQGALGYIQQALEMKPDYLDAYILRSQIKVSQGDTLAPKNELTHYTEVAPYDPQGFLLLGNALLELHEYQAALTAFATAKELAPTNANVYLQYISALEYTGNRSQAISELRNFQKRFPKVQGIDDQIKRIQGNMNSAPTPDITPAQ
jgi:tetratricopeptide (TPR) repeat protein